MSDTLTKETKHSLHPSIQRYLANGRREEGAAQTLLQADHLLQLCLEAGASDAGFAQITSPHLDGQRQKILQAYPRTKSLISFVCRMNTENVRNPARSAANLEFHSTTDETNHVARKIVATLAKQGVRAVNPASGFPMEMEGYPDKQIWLVAHKPVAVAAGMGKMGIHRNVIHPKFGSFIILGTILLDAEISAYNTTLDYNPCLSCKLCVAACPVGAIHADGYFNFSACYTHNYREFMGGFSDFVGQIADSKNAEDLNKKVGLNQIASFWQSLSFGANYKAAYCLAVCPAGDDIIGQYLSAKADFLEEIVRPLQRKEETVYVVPKSDAEEYVAKRFPHKKIQHVRSGLNVTTISGFLRGMPIIFQPGKAANLNKRYHFIFYGQESAEATVIIKDGRVKVLPGRQGDADLSIKADSRTWIKFLNNRNHLVAALITGKIKLKGSPAHLVSFGNCFVS